MSELIKLSKVHFVVLVVALCVLGIIVELAWHPFGVVERWRSRVRWETECREIASRLGFTFGPYDADGYRFVQVLSVTPGGAFDAAGIRSGDILESVEGRGADWIFPVLAFHSGRDCTFRIARVSETRGGWPLWSDTRTVAVPKLPPNIAPQLPGGPPSGSENGVAPGPPAAER